MTAVDRVKSRQIAVQLHEQLVACNKTFGPPGVLSLLRGLPARDVRRLCSFHQISRPRHGARKFCDIARLLAHVPAYGERVLVKAEVYWGRHWTGSHYEPTPGRGAHCQVMTHHTDRRSGAGFRGCPLGDGPTVRAAVADFVVRGQGEYRGQQILGMSMIDVVETVDHRLGGVLKWAADEAGFKGELRFNNRTDLDILNDYREERGLHRVTLQEV